MATNYRTRNRRKIRKFYTLCETLKEWLNQEYSTAFFEGEDYVPYYDDINRLEERIRRLSKRYGIPMPII